VGFEVGWDAAANAVTISAEPVFDVGLLQNLSPYEHLQAFIPALTQMLTTTKDTLEAYGEIVFARSYPALGVDIYNLSRVDGVEFEFWADGGYAVGITFGATMVLGVESVTGSWVDAVFGSGIVLPNGDVFVEYNEFSFVFGAADGVFTTVQAILLP